MGRLRGKGLRCAKKCDDSSPAEGIVNIMDVMLVFACGLMVAMIINWNVDIARIAEDVDLTVGSEVTQVEELQQEMIENMESEAGYEKMGILYKDPISGKMYMLTEEGGN